MVYSQIQNNSIVDTNITFRIRNYPDREHANRSTIVGLYHYNVNTTHSKYEHIQGVAGENVIRLAASSQPSSTITESIFHALLLSPPTELPDVSGYPLLLAELTRDRRWPSSDIKKLVGGNLLRVLKEVERQATSLSNLSPAEEWIPRELIEDTAYCRYLGV